MTIVSQHKRPVIGIVPTQIHDKLPHIELRDEYVQAIIDDSKHEEEEWSSLIIEASDSTDGVVITAPFYFPDKEAYYDRLQAYDDR